MAEHVDAVVIGSGPNGLVAANLLADAGWDVLVLEAQAEPGGAVRSGELIPGYRHDLFSGFYPLAPLSPALRDLELERFGLVWRRARYGLAHPTADGRCAAIGPDVETTSESLAGFAPGDGAAWAEMMSRWDRIGPALLEVMLGPVPAVRGGAKLARALLGSGDARGGGGGARGGRGSALDFARLAVLPVRRLVEETFTGEGAALVLAGNALQADVSPEAPPSGLLGWIVSAITQVSGNPAPEGGASGLTDALVRRLRSAGGELRCSSPVSQVVVRDGRAVGVRTSGGDLVTAGRAVLADVSAPSLYGSLLADEELPARLVADLGRFHWDPATVKVDWALSAPVPWSAPEARQAATVNIADSLDELSLWASDIERGVVSRSPYVLIGQHASLDPTRQPPGCDTLTAYVRVPRVVKSDAAGEISGRWDAADEAAMVERIEARIDERAPGWRPLVVGRKVLTPPGFAALNANLDAGAINGGTAQLHQLLVFRPTPGSGRPSTFVERLYLASSSAHPGGGVHGACGANAARAALAGARVPPALRTAWHLRRWRR